MQTLSGALQQQHPERSRQLQPRALARRVGLCRWASTTAAAADGPSLDPADSSREGCAQKGHTEGDVTQNSNRLAGYGVHPFHPSHHIFLHHSFVITFKQCNIPVTPCATVQGMEITYVAAEIVKGFPLRCRMQSCWRVVMQSKAEITYLTFCKQ